MNKIYTSVPTPSRIIKHDTFGIQATPKSLWTPEAQKSIYLTGLEATGPQGVSIILSDDTNDFMVLRITESSNAVKQTFYSPYRLKQNNTLFYRTSDAEIKCSTSGATTVTQIPFEGRTNFVNESNAAGLHNGSFAALPSGLLIASGMLVLDYNIRPAIYEDLDIHQVLLKFYCRLSLTLAVGVSTMTMQWRPNSAAGWIILGQESLSLIGTIDYLTNPLEYDITDEVLSAPNPWEVIDTLQTGFSGIHTGLGLGNNIQLDAIEIQLCTTGKNKITAYGYEK